MKLYCIKIKSAWWGNLFEPGRWYDSTISISDFMEYQMIVDESSYFEKMRMVASKESRKLAESGTPQEKIKEQIPGYMTLSEIRDSFTIKVYIPVYLVKDEQGTRNVFIQTTRKKLMVDYGIDKIKFTTTVDFVEDYFIDISKVREDKLKILGI